ncbi:MAG: hypothetical protein ACOC1F_05275 [Myxococcota bacterium]
MTTCTRCLLTHQSPNVRFDDDGVCNHCATYEAHAHKLRDFDALRPLLHQRFDRVRGKQRYDALVGLSGGKDSSYVAYKLVREHGLTVLLMTYDNGFLTDYAKKNIAHIVEQLGQDHVFCSPSRPVHRAIYRSSLRLSGVPCVGCTLPGFLHAFKLAVDKDIPLLVHGRTRAQMFKGLAPGSTDPFLPMLSGGFRPYDPETARAQMLRMARKLGRTLRLFAPQPALRAELNRLFSPDLDKLQRMTEPPELIGYFLYEPYDEEGIKATLEQAIAWKRSDDDHLMGHDDCSVHAVAAYLHNVDYGYPILRPELSTMIREGDITRDAAQARLEREHCAVKLNEASLDALCEMTWFTPGRVLSHAHRISKAMVGLRAWLGVRNRFFPPGDLELMR